MFLIAVDHGTVEADGTGLPNIAVLKIKNIIKC